MPGVDTFRMFQAALLACLVGIVTTPDRAVANPMKGDCRGLYREYLSQGSKRSFATRKDKRACGWAGGYATQAEADRRALQECRKHGSCYILTNTAKEAETADKRSRNKRIQTSLNKLGFDVGTADGVFGPATRRGIMAFQGSIAAAKTGKLTPLQEKRLFERVAEDKLQRQKDMFVEDAVVDSSQVLQLVVDRSRRTLFGLKADGSALIWDAPTGRVIYDAIPSAVSVSLSDDGKQALYANSGGRVTQVDLETGERSVFQLRGILDPAVHYVDAQRIAVMSPGGDVFVVDRSTRDRIEVDTGGRPARQVVVNQADQSLVILTEAGGLVSADLARNTAASLDLPGVASALTQVVLVDGGKSLVALEGTRKLHFFRADAGRWTSFSSFDYGSDVVSFDFLSGRNEIVVAGARSVEVLNASTGQRKLLQAYNFFGDAAPLVKFIGRSGRIVGPANSGDLYMRTRGGADRLSYQRSRTALLGTATSRRKKAEATARAEQRAFDRAVAEADQLFDAGSCVAFSQVDADYRQDRTQADCDAHARETAQRAEIETALSAFDCDGASALASGVAGYENRIAECRATKERRANEARFATAMEAGDCTLVGELEQALGRSGSVDVCRFNAAMTADTAKKMFIAAARYDAGNDRARAKLIYTEILDRFPEDDISLQAAVRLTALNDLERSEQARREMEAEMARLKREAEEAQRKAEEARRAAAQAQAAAQRRAAADARAKPVRSPCAHVYRGKRVQIIPDAPNNAKQALGFIFQGGLYGTNFEVTGVGRSEATLYSLDTGRSFQMPCGQVP